MYFGEFIEGDPPVRVSSLPKFYEYPDNQVVQKFVNDVQKIIGNEFVPKEWSNLPPPRLAKELN